MASVCLPMFRQPCIAREDREQRRGTRTCGGSTGSSSLFPVVLQGAESLDFSWQQRVRVVHRFYRFSEGA